MPPAATTDGSQQTVTSGTAVQIAAETVKLRLLRLFAREHNLDINLLDTKDDFVVDRDGSRLASIEEAGLGLIFRATERFDQRATRPVDDANSDEPVHVTFGFSVNRCVVDVDVELGLVKVVQMDVVQDIGTVVNPGAGAWPDRGRLGAGLGTRLDGELEGGRRLSAQRRLAELPHPHDRRCAGDQCRLRLLSRTGLSLRLEGHRRVTACANAARSTCGRARGDRPRPSLRPGNARVRFGCREWR